MLVLAEQQQPDLATDPFRRRFLAGMTLRLAINLLLHGVVVVFAAGGERSTWLFVAGPLQYIFFGAQFLVEIAWGRLTIPPEDPSEAPPEVADPPPE